MSLWSDRGWFWLCCCYDITREETLMPSVSFDAIAHLYDQTRGYPDDVAAHVTRAIIRNAHATAQTDFIEVGVGTGRIALPLATLGRSYTGVDISANMLALLDQKAQTMGWQVMPYVWGDCPDEGTPIPVSSVRFDRAGNSSTLRLVNADISQLPFHTASFDCVIAVHIFHLVDGWQEALSEVIRVLKPGGRLLHCWDIYEKSETSVMQNLNDQWYTIIGELGGTVQRPGASIPAVKRWLADHHLSAEDQRVYSWKQPVVPRAALESITQRYWSSTWMVSDDIFAASIERLRSWASDYYPDLDREYAQERHFIISTTIV
jgi:ubiquinone/menaquinone biosynthesis C-methylase UbiE